MIEIVVNHERKYRKGLGVYVIENNGNIKVNGVVTYEQRHLQIKTYSYSKRKESAHAIGSDDAPA